MANKCSVFPYEGMAMVERFGKIKYCKVLLNDRSIKVNNPPDMIFRGDQILWIDRVEDEYGTHHYKDRCAVKLYRKDFIRGTSDNG